MKIIVTGSQGFIGRNLCEALKAIRDGKDRRQKYKPLLPLTIYEYDRSSTLEELDAWCSDADFVFNLAGANRPDNPDEFMETNCNFGSTLLQLLRSHNNSCPVMLSSSIQATLKGRYANSAYGKSKLAGEDIFFAHGQAMQSKVLVYRFPNVYGKWCCPNYNSAIATFCDAIANNKPFEVNDPSVTLELLYIDDLVDEMLGALLSDEHRCNFEGTTAIADPLGKFCFVPTTDRITLGAIIEQLEDYREARVNLCIPNIPDGSFSKKLYSTFLSYYEPNNASYSLAAHEDARGSFTEFFRTSNRGQVSINISKPGVTKGNHWHNSKWEKFLVVSGRALIKQRRVGRTHDGTLYPVAEYIVSGHNLQVVEMIPGYTHSITNISDKEDLVTVIWANEPFDSDNPDTYYEEV